MMRHLHQAVTNTKDWNPQIKNPGVNLRRTAFVNARWAAGEDNAIWWRGRNCLCRSIEADNLRVDLKLANATANDLGVLRTEIED